MPISSGAFSEGFQLKQSTVPLTGHSDAAVANFFLRLAAEGLPKLTSRGLTRLRLDLPTRTRMPIRAIFFAFRSPVHSNQNYAIGMLKHRRENRLIHVLVCWKCGGRSGPNHYVLEGGGATCSLYEDKNPLGNLRRMPVEVLRATYEIVLCFGPSRKQDGAVSVMALHLDCKTVLGRYRDVASDEAMVRMLRYLGATEEQIARTRQTGVAGDKEASKSQCSLRIGRTC
jgi:hypothetical protein